MVAKYLEQGENIGINDDSPMLLNSIWIEINVWKKL